MNIFAKKITIVYPKPKTTTRKTTPGKFSSTTSTPTTTTTSPLDTATWSEPFTTIPQTEMTTMMPMPSMPQPGQPEQPSGPPSGESPQVPPPVTRKNFFEVIDIVDVIVSKPK